MFWTTLEGRDLGDEAWYPLPFLGRQCCRRDLWTVHKGSLQQKQQAVTTLTLLISIGFLRWALRTVRTDGHLKHRDDREPSVPRNPCLFAWCHRYQSRGLSVCLFFNISISICKQVWIYMIFIFTYPYFHLLVSLCLSVYHCCSSIIEELTANNTEPRRLCLCIFFFHSIIHFCYFSLHVP